MLDGELVGYWLVTRPGVRPVVVHSGWRTEPAIAVAIVRASVRKARTPEPVRRARELARHRRSEWLHRPDPDC